MCIASCCQSRVCQFPQNYNQITKGYSLPTVVALIKILMFEIVFQLKLVRTKLHNNTRLREIWLSYSPVTSWTQCQTSHLSFHRTTSSKPVASSCCHSTGQPDFMKLDIICKHIHCAQHQEAKKAYGIVWRKIYS